MGYLLDNSDKKINTVKEINDLAINSPEEFIASSEQEFTNQVKQVIDHIVNSENKCKLILITGPSSSGKTTFSKILRSELRRLKIWNDMISLDNFYRGINNIPVLEDGSKDFEALECLDVNQIKKVLSDLLEKGHGDIPLYDFEAQAISGQTVHIEVPQDGIIIVEGIHAINPKLTEGLSDHSILKIYIDVKGGILTEAGDTFIVPESIRLIRRICRDYKYRYTLPVRTMGMWKNVRRGEDLYIKPLEKCADFIINSFHSYEPCIMANDAVPFLNSIPEEFKMSELKEKMALFKLLDQSLVPKGSLLREFI